MVAVIFIFFVLYFGLLMILYSGFVRIIEQAQPEATKSIHSLSVIVPFRNEEQNIFNVLGDLFQQNYPTEKFEILLVNDHSEDHSMQKAEEAIKMSSFSKCIFIHPAKSGKKAAITEGVRQASGDVIVTIDADCRVGRDWLKSINAIVVDQNIKMVFGAVRIEPDDSIFSNMQSIEFSSLIGSGAASLAHGVPTMCNGANLAFRKETFNEVNGYEGNMQIASGDDEFLMRKISRKYPKGIAFNNYKPSIVITYAQSALSDFLAQRIRWAGKWRAHHDIKSKLLALFIFSFHALLLASPFFIMHNKLALVVFGVLFLCKAIVEYRFLRIVNFWLNARWNWLAFILLQLTYSLYAVVTALAALVVLPHWKGRKI
jgi:cellulose synthase/poly-beta-1,6-N-acetylglucosamine synthase-like glycosyltransferase